MRIARVRLRLVDRFDDDPLAHFGRLQEFGKRRESELPGLVFSIDLDVSSENEDAQALLLVPKMAFQL